MKLRKHVKDKVISEGILINEINNGAVLLCANHHREEHNPNSKMTLVLKGISSL